MKFTRKMPQVVLAGVGALVAAGVVATFMWSKPGPAPAFSKESPPTGSKPKILLVNSYHPGYLWSDSIVEGAFKTLQVHRTDRGEPDCSESPVVLSVCYMDTKRNGSAQFKRQAGLRVKGLIESFKPDVVICTDDNAAAYVIVPYYRNAKLPLVFCGINWDASDYGLPCRNVTGMLEVAFIPKLETALRTYARGGRVGLLGARNESNIKEALYYGKRSLVKIEHATFVDTLAQWKQAYIDIQDKVDMLILAPPSFIETEQDQADARAFVLQNTKIPTGSVEEWIAPYSLVCYAKVGGEQGEWAARAALRILSGVSPDRIPVAVNHHARLCLNMPLAKKLGIRFPVEMIEQASLISEK